MVCRFVMWCRNKNKSHSYESGMNELLSATRSLIMGEPIEYMDDIIQKVDAVTSNDILEVANCVFEKKQLSQIVFKGVED